MSDAGDFVDRTLQYEATWERAAEAQARLGTELGICGASVGAVRGTMRDLARRYKNMTHDEVTALSSELWNVPVFERRLAATLRSLHLRALSHRVGVDHRPGSPHTKE